MNFIQMPERSYLKTAFSYTISIFLQVKTVYVVETKHFLTASSGIWRKIIKQYKRTFQTTYSLRFYDTNTSLPKKGPSTYLINH